MALLSNLPGKQNKIWAAAQIRETHLCAGHEFGGQDGCQGDSGGGLVSVDGDSGKYVLVGVMSTGIGCGRKKLPGVYTRDANSMHFLKTIIKIIMKIHEKPLKKLQQKPRNQYSCTVGMWVLFIGYPVIG